MLFFFTFEARLTFLVELKQQQKMLSEINGQTIHIEVVNHMFVNGCMLEMEKVKQRTKYIPFCKGMRV